MSYRPFVRLTYSGFSLILSLTLLCACGSNPPTNVTEELAREQLGISIMSVNLLGVANVPRDNINGVAWRTRYSRIFSWMAENRKFPDIIVLQETTAFMQCAFDATVRDYEALNFLRNGISSAAGEQYRIAYLIVGKPGGGKPTDYTGNIPSGGCSSSYGKAMMYRPSKIRNVITDARPNETLISPYTNPFPLLNTHLVMSAQCCPLNVDGSDLCPVSDFMDGPMIMPPVSPVFRSGCLTRAGLAYVRHRAATQGSDRTRPFDDAIFSRLELVSQPGNFIHLYNVHRGWNEDFANANPPGALAPVELDFGQQNMNALITDMESRFQSNGALLYPPLLVGDFNVGAEVIPTYFPRFDAGFFFSIDGVAVGKRSVFNSKQTAYINLGEQMPALLEGENCENVPAKLWSDHCGVFFRVEPSPR